MNYTDDKIFAERIVRLRKERGLTQNELAAKLQLEGYNITRSTISKIESGQRHLYAFEARAISVALSVSADDLLSL